MQPEKRNPTHPGEILRHEFLDPLGQSQVALAEHLGIAKPAVTRALDALERLDFIRRLPDDTDLRSIFVERTPEGMGYLRAFARLVLAAASGEETSSGKPPGRNSAVA